MPDLLTLAIILFVLAIVAAVLGMWGVAGMSMEFAKWLVIAFIVLAILSFLLSGSYRLSFSLMLMALGL